MSALLSSLGCCIWWFLAGLTLGWLLNRWLCKCCCNKPNVYTPQATSHTPPTPPTPTVNTAAATATPIPATVSQTFAQLAKATVPEMRTILDNAGPRYRIANPSTWAEQAALAADNKWAELKALQDALSAGIKK
jgi:hypothetical protein